MVQRTVLPNGLKILTEEMPSLQSASMGIWVDTGSSHEVRGEGGLAHYIEHMLFKGTQSRTAKEIAVEFDAMGGQVNAVTSKEYTCYYTKTLGKDLQKSLEILADMLLSPAIAQKDVENERNVILEEYSMYEDSPEDLVSDRLFEGVWAGTSLGTNILGTPSALKRVNREKLLKFMEKNYTPAHMVISVCGNFDRDGFIAAVQQLFGGQTGKRGRRSSQNISYLPCITTKEKEFEQSHICFAFEGLCYGDNDSYILTVLNNILGNGMSSRLFQKIREDMGLVYTVYSFITPHRESGVTGVYAAFNHSAQEKANEAILREIKQLRQNGITQQELDFSKKLLKTNLIMGFESSYARMSHMAKGELFGGNILTLQQMDQRIEEITVEKANVLADRLFDPQKLSVSIVGKVLPGTYYDTLRSF